MVRNLSEKTKQKKMIEALLFATNDGFTIEEISDRTGFDKEDVKKVINSLRKENKDRESAIEILEEENKWRMKIMSEVAPVVSDLLPYEIPNQILKTLAIIAYKNPARQSEVVKIRGNKAYSHIKDLKEQEYITSHKKGRTNILKLAPKFFKYFDLSRRDTKEILKFKESNIHKEQNTINKQDNQIKNKEVEENGT